MSVTKFYPSQLLTANDASSLISNQITSQLIIRGIFDYEPATTYYPFDYIKDSISGNIFICKTEIPAYNYAVKLDSPIYIGIIPNTTYYAVSVLNYKQTNTSTPKNGILILNESTPYAFIEAPSVVSADIITTCQDTNSNSVLNTGLWFSNTNGVYNIKFDPTNSVNPFKLTQAVEPPGVQLDNVTQIQIKNGYIFLAQYGDYIYYTTSPTIIPNSLNVIGFWSGSVADSTTSPYIYFSDSSSDYTTGLIYFLNTSGALLSLNALSTLEKDWKCLAINGLGVVYCTDSRGGIYVVQKNSSNVPSSLNLLPDSPINLDTLIEQKTIVDYLNTLYFIGMSSIWTVSKDNVVSSIDLKNSSPISFGLNTKDGIPFFFSYLNNYVYKITNVSQISPSYQVERLTTINSYMTSAGLTYQNNISCPSQATSGYLFYLDSQTLNVSITSDYPDFNDINSFGLVVYGNTPFLYGGTLGLEVPISTTLSFNNTMSYISSNNVELTLFNPTTAPKYTIGIPYKILCKFPAGNSTLLLPSNVKISGESSMVLNPYDSLTIVHDGSNFYLI